jgi:hypothetical protein
MTDEQLDELVFATIQKGIHAMRVTIARHLGVKNVDKPLQRLRKAGRIRYNGPTKRWVVQDGR